MTNAETACLAGALELSKIGELIGPTSAAGAVACAALEKRGFLRLIGWRTERVSAERLYEITPAGIAAAGG